MKTCAHLWQYFAEFFVEQEMFQNHAVEKIKTHVVCLVTVSENCAVCENVVNYGRARQATDDNIIQRMRLACWIPKATNTHSEFGILISFSLQQWLRELASLLRLYVHCSLVQHINP
jgi:hypothetical protein